MPETQGGPELRSIKLTAVGWDGPLVAKTGPLPEATGDLVLVEVAACGVCHRDCIDRDGRFPYLQLPITPGHEAAGTVVAVGPDVTGLKLGDAVITLHRDRCGVCTPLSLIHI